MSTKMGIIISIEKYQSNASGLSTVKYATNDSKEVRKVFIEKIGIEEDNIYYYKDEQFTLAVGKSELQYYLRQMSCDTELYIYYAGHGFFLNGRNYLTVYDTSTIDLVETSLSFDDLFLNSFKLSGAKTCVAFVDACAEGLTQYQRGIGLRGIEINVASLDIHDDLKYALYFSCSPKEKSVSDDNLQHGVWTWFLLKALNGDVKAYDNGNYISTTSLEKYLKSSVIEYTKKKTPQTPYSVIASNDSWKLVDFGKEESFEDLICQAYDEFIFQCNLADQELVIGSYGDINNFALARDLCWSISDKLCYGWDEIVTSLEFYMNALESGKRLNLTYAEQKDLLAEFDRLNQSFPTYLNDIFYR